MVHLHTFKMWIPFTTWTFFIYKDSFHTKFRRSPLRPALYYISYRPTYNKLEHLLYRWTLKFFSPLLLSAGSAILFGMSHFCSFQVITLSEFGCSSWQPVFGFPDILLKVSTRQWHGSIIAACFCTHRQRRENLPALCLLVTFSTLAQYNKVTPLAHKCLDTHTHTLLEARCVCVPSQLSLRGLTLLSFSMDEDMQEHTHTVLIHTSYLCWHPGRHMQRKSARAYVG